MMGCENDLTIHQKSLDELVVSDQSDRGCIVEFNPIRSCFSDEPMRSVRNTPASERADSWVGVSHCRLMPDDIVKFWREVELT